MLFYNRRGNCEQWIKEGKYALTWRRLSYTRFASNQVRLGLFVLAFNLGNFLRRFALPKKGSHWSLRSAQLKLIKIGAKVVSHSVNNELICLLFSGLKCPTFSDNGSPVLALSR